MSNYDIEPDGEVKSNGRVVAFFEPDGRVLDRRFGQPIGFIESSGEIKDRQFGQTLAVVTSDGVVREKSQWGQEMGKVGPPVHKRAALMVLLG